MGVIQPDFEVQAAKSNYTKLTIGKHRLRVLGPAISGYEWWEDTPDGGRRPERCKDTDAVPMSHADDVRKFLAMPVWNYDQGRIQIFSITQATIQRELKALDRDNDWGSLLEYDLEIERTGNDKNTTKYRVTPKPKAPFNDDIIKEVKDKGLPALEALYVGGDPFNWNEEGTLSLEEEKKLDDLPF